MAIGMRNDNFTIAVIMPLAHSSITGGALAIATGTMSAAFSAYIQHYFPDSPDPVMFGFAIGCTAFAFAWLKISKETRDAILGIQKPEKTEKVEKKEVSVRFDVYNENNGYLQADWLTLPPGIELDQMVSMADMLINRRASFSHASLAGPRRIFTRSEFESIREFCLYSRWVVWNNPRAHNQGLTLTRVGSQIMRKLIAMDKKNNPPPPPGMKLQRMQ